MKKIMIVMLVGVLGYFYVFFSRCGILPKDANYKIMLGIRLNQLTRHGLTEFGTIQDPWDMISNSSKIILNKKQKEIYFYCVEEPDRIGANKIRGICKIKLDNFMTKPTLILVTNFPSDVLSLSPDSNFLFFSVHSTIFSLDLKTGQQRVVVDDCHDLSNIIWLNDHQFIYSSTKLRGVEQGYDLVLAVRGTSDDQIKKVSKRSESDKLPVLIKGEYGFSMYGMQDGVWCYSQLFHVSAKLRSLPFSEEPVIIRCDDPELIGELITGHTTRKRIMFLYDMKTGIKTDFHFDGYYLGTLSPDGKKLLLADNDKTILYNIHDGSSEVIANRKTWIERAIWLPDGKGFLYSDAQVGELFEILCDGHYGLYYYSLEKKRSVRLSQYYNLTSGGGFVVPDNIEIKLPDTKLNRRIWSGELDNHHLVKIGTIDGLIEGVQNVFQVIVYLLGW